MNLKTFSKLLILSIFMLSSTLTVAQVNNIDSFLDQLIDNQEGQPTGVAPATGVAPQIEYKYEDTSDKGDLLEDNEDYLEPNVEVQVDSNQEIKNNDFSNAPLLTEAVKKVVSIKVGMIIDLSSQEEKLKKEILWSFQQGVLRTNSDTKIDLVVKSVSNLNLVTAAYKELVKDGVKVIVGPIRSNSLKQISKMALDDGVVLLSFSSDHLSAGENAYAFGVYPEEEVKTITRYMATERKKSKFLALVPSTPSGDRILKAFKQQVAQSGTGDIICYASYGNNTRSYKALTKGIANRNSEVCGDIDPIIFEKYPINEVVNKLNTKRRPIFDAVFIAGGGIKMMQLASHLVAENIMPPRAHYFGISSWSGTELELDPVFKAAFYIEPNNDNSHDFASSFKSLFQKNPTRLAYIAYDLGVIVAIQESNGVIDIVGNQPNDGYEGVLGKFKVMNDGYVTRSYSIRRTDGSRRLTQKVIPVSEDNRYFDFVETDDFFVITQ